MEPEKYGLIFIGGVPRSGTTLIQRIIGAHSMVYAGPEFDLVPEIMRLREQFIQKLDAGRISSYLDLQNINSIFKNFILSVFEKKTQETGKHFISEKTPSNLEVFINLQECLPDARYIFVMRDPRSIVASLLEVGRRYRRDQKSPPPFTGNAGVAVEYINRLWNKGNEARLKSKNVYVVYYEDIVTMPKEAIEAMMVFLGLPFENGLMNIQESRFEMPEFNSGEEYWYSKEQLIEGIRPGEDNKWRELLSDYDLYVIGKRLSKIPGLTDRYEFECNDSLILSLKYRLMDFIARFRQTGMIRILATQFRR